MAKKKVTLEKRPCVLIIRDGWGYHPDPGEDAYNAIKVADTPVDDMLMREYPNCLIHSSGEDVGLPVAQWATARSDIRISEPGGLCPRNRSD